MKLPRRNFLRLAAGAAALPAVSHAARAQAYPSRPITMMVPFPPGGLSGAGAAPRAAVPPAPRAKAYPSRPITMMVPFPPGGLTDVVGRLIAEGMRTALGQAIIIENVGGATGSTGTGRVARAAPDGYT